MPEQSDQQEEASGRPLAASEGELEKREMRELVDHLEHGELSREEQVELFHHLADEMPREVVVQRLSQMSFSGPIPPPDVLNQFDEETRRTIVQMAVDDQKHVHMMNQTGLQGSINKDRRGQMCGVTIAVVGLIAAVLIAPHSAVAAGLIGTLDLFGMVALFVAPRVLEGRQKKREQEEERSKK